MFRKNRHRIVQAMMKHTPETLSDTLRKAHLRPTRQRLALAELLFSKGDRHLSAENLYEEAKQAGVAVSLATIYNTLHQFTDCGLLRSISVDSTKTYFDTNTSNHHHFFNEKTDELLDMPNGLVEVGDIPTPPQGMEISRVDVVVRIRPNQN